MLPVKKIFVDTRQRSSDSVSHTDFHIDLPTTLLMPEDTGFYIEDICIPVSWWTIEEYKNDIFSWQDDGVNNSSSIPPGNYTTDELGAALVKAMNTNATNTIKFVSEYVRPQDAIRIAWANAYIGSNQTKSFKNQTDNDLSLLGGRERDIAQSINSLIRNFTENQTYVKSYPFVSGYVGMNPTRNAYFCSSGLGHFQTLSLTGDRNIIKKIPLDGVTGDIVYDQWGSGGDYLDCSNQTLSRIFFLLRDVFGRTLDTHGVHWSFTLVFARVSNGH